MIPVVALQMIPVIFGKMLSITLSGGFAPPAAWQTTAVFFMVLSAARKRYCFMCYKRYCLRAMIIIENSIRPIAIGRKNYLFCKNDDAAEDAAIIYTMMG